MVAYCTYCSREKDTRPGPLPAILRYQSRRIRDVAERAARDGASLVILSGEFGLLQPSDPIPYYDHLLQPAEVSAMIERVALQLRTAGITAVTYFTESLSDPELAPYNATIRGAASAIGIPAGVRILEAGRSA